MKQKIMFEKVAEYYRKGETGKGIKLLEKILLRLAKSEREGAEFSAMLAEKNRKAAARKAARDKKKAATTTKETT